MANIYEIISVNPDGSGYYPTGNVISVTGNSFITPMIANGLLSSTGRWLVDNTYPDLVLIDNSNTENGDTVWKLRLITQ